MPPVRQVSDKPQNNTGAQKDTHLMAIKQGHQTYSGNSSGMGSSSSAIIVLLTLGIIIGLVVAGFFMMG